MDSKSPVFDIQTYAASLYQRRNDGVILTPAEAGIGDWRPAPHRCHLNVDTLCRKSADFRAVRGWLVFDLYLFYRFTAHSVVRASDGALYDITPSMTSRQYPFVTADLPEEGFAELIDMHRIAHLEYCIKTGETGLIGIE